jgi:transcriptional regulator with XRE-family HTH domain
MPYHAMGDRPRVATGATSGLHGRLARGSPACSIGGHRNRALVSDSLPLEASEGHLLAYSLTYAGMVTPSDRLAGELIGEIRRKGGLSQAELARRTGIPRSVLSAYEHGHRQPAVAALARIATAAGMELALEPASDRPQLARAGKILAQVLDLAEQLPYRPRHDLAYPPLIRLAA